MARKNNQKKKKNHYQKKEMFVDRLNKEVSKMNIKVETYNKLLPLSLSIINKHLDSFRKVEISLTDIQVNLKQGAQVPALFCESESVGLVALLHSLHSATFNYYPSDEDHRWIKFTLK